MANFRTIIFIILAGVILLLPVTGYSYSYSIIGVRSNLLIYDDKVHFIQVGGEFTVLDLMTGNVITRKQARVGVGGYLVRTNAGILCQSSGMGKTILFDPVSMELVWEAPGSRGGVANDLFVSSDGNGFIECRKTDTGRVLWSYSLPGALDVVVDKETVLVFRAATYDSQCETTVVVLDVKTGRELLRKTAPDGIHYLSAWFHGEHIYLASGSYTKGAQSRQDAVFEAMIVWDLNGNEVYTLPAPDGLRIWGIGDRTFSLGGKTFEPGRVSEHQENEPVRRHRYGIGGWQSDVFGPVHFQLAGDGFVSFDGALIALESGRGNWKGILPYMKSGSERVFVVSSTDDKIILGTNRGHVECIDIATGKSLWLYIFPVMRGKVSFAHGDVPPYLVSEIVEYEKQQKHPELIAGIELEGSNQPSKPKVVFDPAPWYSRVLTHDLAFAWGGAFLCLLALAVLTWIQFGCGSETKAYGIACLVVFLIAFWFFFEYGRTSLPSSLALGAATILPLLATIVSAVWDWRQERPIKAVLLFITVVMVLYFVSKSFDYSFLLPWS